jgi:hypothetical protein
MIFNPPIRHAITLVMTLLCLALVTVAALSFNRCPEHGENCSTRKKKEEELTEIET